MDLWSMEIFLVGMIFAGLAVMAGGLAWTSFQARRDMFRS